MASEERIVARRQVKFQYEWCRRPPARQEIILFFQKRIQKTQGQHEIVPTWSMSFNRLTRFAYRHKDKM